MNTEFILVYKALLKRDLMIYRRQFFKKFLDTFFLLFTNLVIFAYFMPKMGVSESYGPFLLIGAIASFGFFDVVGKVAELIGDIDGDRRIYYTMSLPISATMVFVYIGLFWAINSFLVALFLFPLGKLIIWDRFDLALINYPKLILIYTVSNLFFGYFSLWLTSMIKGGLDRISMIWVRIINPVFMFGGYFYTQAAASSVSPIIGYISLINPMVYVMEGMRAAALGQTGYLPFWGCFFALIGFILFFSSHGIKRLKKRLDCI